MMCLVSHCITSHRDINTGLIDIANPRNDLMLLKAIKEASHSHPLSKAEQKLGGRTHPFTMVSSNLRRIIPADDRAIIRPPRPPACVHKSSSKKKLKECFHISFFLSDFILKTASKKQAVDVTRSAF